MDIGFQKDHDAGHQDNSSEVLFFVLVAYHTSSVVV